MAGFVHRFFDNLVGASKPRSRQQGWKPHIGRKHLFRDTNSNEDILAA
jgi:hypothetical protein